MTNEYTNLARVRLYLSLASQNTQDDRILLNFMGRASRAIDRYTRRKFYPRQETRFFDYEKPQEVRLDDDMLALTTLKYQNGACTISSGVMWLGTGKSWNYPPYDRIVLDKSSGSVLNYSGTPQRAIEVTATWGYHEDWANAWVDTGTSLAGAYNIGAGSLSLAGAGSAGTGASDIEGDFPRMGVGDILKIGEQYFSVTGGTTSGNDVMIRGAMNGTTAASYASGASIARFAPEPDIEWATRRLVVWEYGQKDTPYETKTANVQFGTISVPTSWPSDVRDRIDRFIMRTYQVIP